jgi:hypothetical protein
MEHNQPGLVVLDGHDAIVLELPDSLDSIQHGVYLLDSAFRRTIQIGDVEFMIPVEYEIGYNLAHMEEFNSPQDAHIAYERVSIGSPVS